MPTITVKDAFSANVVVNTINSNGSATSANSSPVVIASDQGPVVTKIDQTTDGTTNAVALKSVNGTACAVVNNGLTNIARVPVILASGAAIGTTNSTIVTSVGGQDGSGNAQAVKVDTDGTANANITKVGGTALALGARAADASIPVALSSETASGSITTQNLVPAGAATAGSAVEITLAGSMGVGIQVTGTYTGALTLQVTGDGTNWITVGGTPFENVNTGTFLATITSALQSVFQVEVGGFVKARVTGLATVTGTAVVTLRASANTAIVSLGVSNLAVNLAQIGGNASNASSPNGSGGRALCAQLAGPVSQTDYSSQAWAASSGSGATIADIAGGSTSNTFDVNVTAWTAGASTGLVIYLQESPDNGTTWYDIWQCETIAAVARTRIPAIPIAGRRRMRWGNLSGAATTATVTITTMGSSTTSPKRVQWFERTASVTFGTAALGNGASFDIDGCTNLTFAMQGGTQTTPASFKVQMSQDNVNWYDASASVALAASAMTLIPLTAGVFGRFGRFVCTTAGTTNLVSAGHCYGSN